MEVMVVTADGPCEPICARWIAAQGRIDGRTPQRFRTVLGKLKAERLPVVIHSSGGSVLAAIEIGQMIRERRLDIAVGRTMIEPCPANDKDCQKALTGGQARGRVDGQWSACLSACPLLLAGGVNRYVGHLAFVGVHEITQLSTVQLIEKRYKLESPSFFAAPERKLVSEKVVATQRTEKPADVDAYSRVAAYLAMMQVSTAIIPLMKSKPADDILILSRKQLQDIALATHVMSAAELVHGQTSAQSPPIQPKAMHCNSNGTCSPVMQFPVRSIPKTESSSLPGIPVSVDPPNNQQQKP